jgi:hypothetical protein
MPQQKLDNLLMLQHWHAGEREAQDPTQESSGKSKFASER